MPTSNQDYRWAQFTTANGQKTQFFRFDMHEFRNPATFANRYNPESFDALSEVVARIPVKAPRFVWDLEGSLDVGAALAGNPECCVKRQDRKAKRLRIGINPSNQGTREDLDGYKAASYAAVIMAAQRMGFLVEAEMCYGGFRQQDLEFNTANRASWSMRVELGTNLPVHVIAAYGSNLAIDEAQLWADTHNNEILNSPTHIQSIRNVAYQTQDAELRNIIRDEYDICFDRLLVTDTLDTLQEFLTRQLNWLNVSEEGIQQIIATVKDMAYELGRPKRIICKGQTY